jgi:hypothetical protein
VEGTAASGLANPLMDCYDEAFVLMERALELLDRAGLHTAAIHLDHAICLIPDEHGNVPRVRLSLPPSLSGG